jgi:membrane protease YdiL (CAAX protease family)
VKERIASLSGRTELLIVLLVAFGITVPGSLAALLVPESLTHRASPPITNASLEGVVLYELVVLALLALFLQARGWTRDRLGIKPSVRDSLLGLGLFVVSNLLYYVLAVGLASVWPTFAEAAISTHLVDRGLAWPNIVLVSVVNPVFEEVFVCGYVVSALKETRGLTTAVNVSAGIRVFYHFYQGPLGIVAIAPMALVFAYWFARTGRLWPLLVAHAVQDFVGLTLGGG